VPTRLRLTSGSLEQTIVVDRVVRSWSAMNCRLGNSAISDALEGLCRRRIIQAAGRKTVPANVRGWWVRQLGFGEFA
jgi:hypothetical protein